MELEGLLTDYHGVACIDATLVTNYHVGRLTQQVRDLAFSFIAPLGANYNDVSQGNIKSATGFVNPRMTRSLRNPKVANDALSLQPIADVNLWCRRIFMVR